jgi:hypothetical protein
MVLSSNISDKYKTQVKDLVFFRVSKLNWFYDPVWVNKMISSRKKRFVLICNLSFIMYTLPGYDFAIYWCQFYIAAVHLLIDVSSVQINVSYHRELFPNGISDKNLNKNLVLYICNNSLMTFSDHFIKSFFPWRNHLVYPHGIIKPI